MGWNLYGHEWAADMLQKHISNGKLRHAYLFSGPEGVGRRTTALRFAQAVNCTQAPSAGETCGTCQTCKQIERMQHADLLIIQAEDGSALKVDQVRELQHFVSLAPYSSRYRVVLLRNFQQATASAQNALLKTLEEPNPKVLMLVTADDPENLLPTITSRCELMRLRPMRAEELKNYLTDERGIEEEKAKLAAQISGGRVGFALQMLENEEFLEARRTWMMDLLMLVGTDMVGRFAYSNEKTNGRKIKRAEAKEKLMECFPYWLSLWRDVLICTTGSKTRITNIDFENEINTIAESVSAADAEKAVRALEHVLLRTRTANLQLMLDNLLMDWPQAAISQ